jgi:hypothetical protein
MNKRQQEKQQHDRELARQALKEELTLSLATDGERTLAEHYFILGMNFKKPKVLKQSNDPYAPFFPMFVKIWHEKYPKLFTSARDGAKMKQIIKHCADYIVAEKKDLTPERLLSMWKWMVNGLEPTWFHGKDLSVIESKFSGIVYELRNGKKINTYNQQPSARRWAQTD